MIRIENPASPPVAGPLRALAQSYPRPDAPSWSGLPFSVRRADGGFFDGARSASSGLLIASDRASYRLLTPAESAWVPGFLAPQVVRWARGNPVALSAALTLCRRGGPSALLAVASGGTELVFDPVFVARAAALISIAAPLWLGTSLEGAGRLVIRSSFDDQPWLAQVAAVRPDRLASDQAAGRLPPTSNFPLLRLR